MSKRLENPAAGAQDMHEALETQDKQLKGLRSCICICKMQMDPVSDQTLSLQYVTKRHACASALTALLPGAGHE